MPLESSLASIQKAVASEAESFIPAGRFPSVQEGLCWFS